jgi:imidazolonepropionase-like amidohydrolase
MLNPRARTTRTATRPDRRARSFVGLFVIATSALFSASCASSRYAAPKALGRGDLAPLAAGEKGYAILCGKLLSVDDKDDIWSTGMLLVRGSKLAYVGGRTAVPAGYTVIDCGSSWATPGMVELHSHIHTGGWGDINDMVMPVNPEFRAEAGMRPSNADIRRACAGGVTTLFGIPGSGTSMGGFGLLYKSKTNATFDEAVVQQVAGMKIAQAYNPERRAGDLGATRAGLYWMLEDINGKALGAIREGRDEPALSNLEKVHRRELPVLIHCAGSDSFPAAARMWKGLYDTRCILSHGCFDAHATAAYEVEMQVPINAGPRTMDFFTTHDGAITGTVQKYLEAGAKEVSLNTDSPVMPEEELFLQGSVSAHLGADPYTMLRACTIHPARNFGIDKRVGSLEPGKDADIVLRTGSPLDPRARVELVLIDGQIQYDRQRDGQWF